MDALVVSQVLLWVLVLVLAGLVLVLARQVGVLHERIAPAGALALARGPSVGEAAPRVASVSLGGSLLRVGDPDPQGRATLLFFVSPRCPVCQALLPTAARLARAEGARLVFASDGDEDDHRDFARSHGLDPGSYLVSAELGLRYRIAKLPYAVLIDPQGVLRAQGLVNSREHLESLFEARRLGVASLQDYLAAALPEPGARP